MKIISFFIFVVLASTESVGQTTDGLTIEIDLKKDYFVPYKGELNFVPANQEIRQKRFDVQIILRNNSPDTLRIWLMSCSWHTNFIVNNNYIEFYSKGCDGNYPRIVTVNPAGSFLLNSTMVREVAWDNPCKGCVGFPDRLYGSKVKTTKIGLIYIDGNKKINFDEYESITTDKSRWTIIWSNPIELDK